MSSTTTKSKKSSKKKTFKFPSAYTVLLAIMICIALVTQVVPGVKKSSISRFCNGTSYRNGRSKR